MENFVFERGRDVVIKLNGNAVGGIQKAVCSTENSFTDIGSFLDDESVYRIENTEYCITLQMNTKSITPFEEQETFDELVIVDDIAEIIYSDCRVENIKLVVDAMKPISCEVKIIAEERKVA